MALLGSRLAADESATPYTGWILMVFKELKWPAWAVFSHTLYTLAQTIKAQILNGMTQLDLLIYASVQSKALQERHSSFTGSLPFSYKGYYFISARVAVTPKPLYLNMEAKFLFQRSVVSQPSASFQIKCVSLQWESATHCGQTHTHQPSSLP